MRIKDEVFGKEVLDSEIQIVGKVSDVIFDKETFEITELVKAMGDKVLIKGEDDIFWFIWLLKNI